MGILDYVRARVLARAGARFQSLLDARVFVATLHRSVSPHRPRPPGHGPARSRIDPADAVRPCAVRVLRRALGADLYRDDFHISIRGLAISRWRARLVLVALTLLNEMVSREPQKKAIEAQALAETFEQSARREAEMVRGLGMRDAATTKWRERRDAALQAQMLASDRTGGFRRRHRKPCAFSCSLRCSRWARRW